MGLTAGKTRIAIDTGTLGDGDSIAAYLVDSAGALITSTLVGGKQSADVNVTQSSGQYAEDSAHSSGAIGNFILGVRNDAGTALAADGDYIPLTTDSTGALRTLAAIDMPGDYAEDSAHTTGDVGLFQLAVRNDNQATTFTSGNGDYSGYAVDDRGALFTKNTAQRSNLQQIVTVGTTAVALPTTPLTNRSSMFIQMLSVGSLYLGSATVTNSGATRGLQLGNGGFVSIDVGPGNAVYGVANAAGKDVAVWEFA